MRKPRKEKPRQRTLSDNELHSLWTGLEGEVPQTRVAIRLLVLLGQRLNETLGMAWGDLGDAVWEIPETLHKGRRKHVVPLPPLAVELISSLPKRGSLVLNGAAANPSRLRARARKAMGETPHWTLHDLRRTCASGMAKEGVDPFVVERVLGHSQPSLAATYNVWSYVGEMREALGKWERRVRGLVEE